MKETLLLIEGVGPDEISETFLVRVMDVAEECGRLVEGISEKRAQVESGPIEPNSDL